MSIDDQIRDFLAQLKDLATALKIDEADLRDAEMIDRLAWSGPVAIADLEGISQDQQRLDRWFGSLDAALRLSVVCPEGTEDDTDREWTATATDHDGKGLAATLGYARNQLCDNLDVTLTVYKDKLTDRLALAATCRRQERLFFFADRLHEILAQSSFKFLESDLLGLGEKSEEQPDDRALLVLVADTPGEVRGPYLAILGNDRSAEAAGFLNAVPSFAPLRAARAVRDDRMCDWDGRPRLLTPDFVALGPSVKAAGLGPCRDELIALGNRLAVGYLADQMREKNGCWRATFVGDRAIHLILDRVSSSTAIYEIFRWVYEEGTMERTKLKTVRRVIPARLPPQAGDLRMAALDAVGSTVLKECEIQLRMLIDENVADSFERRRRFDQLIRHHLDEVGTSIRALTKEVVDNAYKTAGLLVGIIIAYLLEPSKGPLVLGLGIALTAGYVLFVRFFYLESVHQDYAGKRDAYEREKQEILSSDLLVADDFRQQLAEVDRRNRLFDDKFDTAAGFYALILVVGAAFLFGYLGIGKDPPSPVEQRKRALAAQVERLQGLDYREIRAHVGASAPPVSVVDPASGVELIPDLTALRDDGTRMMLAYLPCSAVGEPTELDRVRALARLAAARKAELHLLTEAACGVDPGPHVVHDWLNAAGLAVDKIWSF